MVVAVGDWLYMGRTDRMSTYISIMRARFLTLEEVNCEYGEGRKLE